MFFFSVLISLCLLWFQLSFKNMQASFRLAHLVIPSVNRGVRVDINQGNSQLHSWPPTHVGSTLTFISRENSLWHRILQASFRFRQDFQLPGCFESLHLSGSFEMKWTVCEFSFLNFLFFFFLVDRHRQRQAEGKLRRNIQNWFYDISGLRNTQFKGWCMSPGVKLTNCVRRKAQDSDTEKENTEWNNKGARFTLWDEIRAQSWNAQVSFF